MVSTVGFSCANRNTIRSYQDDHIGQLSDSKIIFMEMAAIPSDGTLSTQLVSLGTRPYMRIWVWWRPIEGFVPGASK